MAPYCAKLSILSLVVCSLQYTIQVTELSTSCAKSTNQYGTLGVRISRLLTGETDVQTPEQNKNPVNLFGGPPGKTTLGGAFGTPGSKLGSDGLLPNSQNTTPKGQEGTEPKGLSLKGESDMQTPEPNKFLVKPDGYPHGNSTLYGTFGTPGSKLGSDGLLPNSQNKTPGKKMGRKPKGFPSKGETNVQTPGQNKFPTAMGEGPFGNSMPGGPFGTSNSKVESVGLLTNLQNRTPGGRMGKKPRGLLGALKHTVLSNKYWIPATLIVFGVYIYSIFSGYFDSSKIVISLSLVTVSIALILLFVLYRFYYKRRGRFRVPKEILKFRAPLA